MVVLHALTRSVRDSAVLLDISAGPDLGDAYWAPPKEGIYLEEVGKPPGRLRVALILSVPGFETIHPECRMAAENAAKHCESLGHHVEEVTERFAEAIPFDELRSASRIMSNVYTLMKRIALRSSRGMTATLMQALPRSISPNTRTGLLIRKKQ